MLGFTIQGQNRRRKLYGLVWARGIRKLVSASDLFSWHSFTCLDVAGNTELLPVYNICN
jgi:hypothetical protein